jgi:hypothetical protein
MPGDGDDAGHCSNGLSAGGYYEASAEDRTVYRRWMRGVIVFYASVLLIFAVAAIATYGDVGLTQLAGILR